MKKNNSYIGISFVILIFGIIFIPKIIDRISHDEVVDGDRHNLVRKGKSVEDGVIDSLAVIGKVPDFRFINQMEEEISNQSYAGKVYVAEFFFTTCPSICPIMNQNMVKIQNEFYGNPDLGIASFTINPDFDTLEVLFAYAESYGITNPNWHLLTGDKEAIYTLANSGFNLYVGEAPEVEGGFEHSGFFALIDQQGNIRSRFDENGNPVIYYDGLEQKGIEMIVEDIKKLLN